MTVTVAFATVQEKTLNSTAYGQKRPKAEEATENQKNAGQNQVKLIKSMAPGRM